MNTNLFFAASLKAPMRKINFRPHLKNFEYIQQRTYGELKHSAEFLA